MSLHFNLIVKILVAAIFILNVDIASAANLTRGPYLQTGTSTSVIVRWRSDEATDSRVRIGSYPTKLNTIIDDAQLTTEHIVQINGLTPNTKYYYAIGSTTERLSGGDNNTYFHTAPKIGERVAFRTWVIGDAGTGTEEQAAVYNAYQNYTGATKTNLWLQLGDNAYPDGTDADFQTNFFNMYPDMLRQSVTWPAFGNHDAHSADSGSQTGPYYNMFSLPKNAEAGGVASGTEAYYSFDYANVHFIVLDSFDTNRTVGAPMYRWLQADLQAASKADWIIAIWHHPPYSKGAHDSDTKTQLIDMRQNFLPLLESYGVDLVLTGHSHSYERSHFINGHYGASTTFDTATHIKQTGNGQIDKDGAYNKHSTGLANSGTVYVVAGASGKLKSGPFDHPAMIDSLYELGSLVLDVNGLTLNAKFINDSGVVRDDFTLTKSSGSTLSSASSSKNLSSSKSTSSVSRSSTQSTATTSSAKSLSSSTSSKTSSQSSQPTNTTVSLQEGFNNYAGATDTYVTSGQLITNYGDRGEILADGADGTKGRLVTLLKWITSSIPKGKTVTAVTIQLNVFDPTTQTYDLYAMNNSWTETTATWSNTNPLNNQGALLGSIAPLTTGVYTITLNTAGVALVQSWVNGNTNNGLMIVDRNNTDGIDIRSSEHATVSSRPKLTITYK